MPQRSIEDLVYEYTFDLRERIKKLEENNKPLRKKKEKHLSHLDVEIKNTSKEFIRESSLKKLWSGRLNVDNSSPLEKVIKSFLAHGKRRKVEKEILRYWPLLSDSLVEQTNARYIILDLPNDASLYPYHDRIDIPLVLKLVQQMGYHPAGLREVIALCNEDPIVRPNSTFNKSLGSGSCEKIVAPADCFAGQYPVIHMGAQVARSFGRVAGDVLSCCDDDFRISTETHILAKRISKNHPLTI